MRDKIKQIIQRAPQDQIDLGEMKISDAELEEITNEIIHSRPHVRDLFLNNNLIGDEGAKILAKTVSSLKYLSSIDLQFNEIGRDGAAAMYTLKKNNSHLQIAFHGNKISNPADLKMIEAESKK